MSGHTGKSEQFRAYRKVWANLSNIGQAWENLNDSDDENDDDDKTMIETGKSDASLAYLALLSLSQCIKDGLTDQQTDRSSYMNVRMYLRHSYNVIVSLYRILNRFGLNHVISIDFTNWLPTDG